MNIAILGGDSRNYYLSRLLVSNGYNVAWCFAENYGEIKKESDLNSKTVSVEDSFFKIKNADAVVLPLPLTKDGVTLNCPFSEVNLELEGIRLYIKDKKVFTPDSKFGGVNYFSDSGVTMLNARLTAVGFLAELIKYEKGDIAGKSALLTGYGNVSKNTAKILLDNGLCVTVTARDPYQLKEAQAFGCLTLSLSQAENALSTFDYIINTVPAKIFSDTAISQIKPNVAYFELASLVHSKAKSLPFAYIDCRGMPGKHTPKGAGEVISDFIRTELKE